VPIENLLDYLEGGESIEDFLEGFPSVSREQVVTFPEETKASGEVHTLSWRDLS